MSLPQNSPIQLIDLNLPTSSPNLPPHYHTTKDLPPHLMPALKAAFDAAKPAFLRLLRSLRPHLVVNDFLQPWAQAAARELNVPAVLFFCAGAATCSFLAHHCTEYGDINGNTKYPFPEFEFPDGEREKLTQFMEHSCNGLRTKERFTCCLEMSRDLVLIKTSRVVEDKYVNYLEFLVGKEVVPVGPLVNRDRQIDAMVMGWLCKKEFCSSMFVSFGSEYFLSREEIEEVANGLDLSGVNFVWVVRAHGDLRVEIRDLLPDGFLERVGERGLVVEDWAPQREILGHESVGGFVSHCGWSSVVEGMVLGVPIVALPMHLDQPLNARLVLEVGAGMEVRGRIGDEKLERGEIARAIKEVMVGEKGADVRRRAKELSEKLKMKGDEEFDVAADKIKHLIESYDKNNGDLTK